MASAFAYASSASFLFPPRLQQDGQAAIAARHFLLVSGRAWKILGQGFTQRDRLEVVRLGCFRVRVTEQISEQQVILRQVLAVLRDLRFLVNQVVECFGVFAVGLFRQ